MRPSTRDSLFPSPDRRPRSNALESSPGTRASAVTPGATSDGACTVLRGDGTYRCIGV